MDKNSFLKLILIFFAVLLIAGSGFAGFKILKDIDEIENQIDEAPIIKLPPPPKDEPGLPPEDLDFSEIDTSNWLTYRNEEYGFEVKYPSILKPDENRNEFNIYKGEKLNTVKRIGFYYSGECHICPSMLNITIIKQDFDIVKGLLLNDAIWKEDTLNIYIKERGEVYEMPQVGQVDVGGAFGITFGPDENSPAISKEVLVPGNKFVLIISGEDFLGYNTSEDEFNKILSTFKFIR